MGFCKDCVYLELKHGFIEAATCKHPNNILKSKTDNWYQSTEVSVYDDPPSTRNKNNTCSDFEDKSEALK